MLQRERAVRCIAVIGLKVKGGRKIDLIFCEEPELSGTVLLEEGDMIIVVQDAHKPRCQAGGPCFVKRLS